MPTGMTVPVASPRPAARVWATAIQGYFPLVGPQYEPDENGAKRWLNGVEFCPYGCDRLVGTVFDPCVERVTDYVDWAPSATEWFPFIAEFAVSAPQRQWEPGEMIEWIVSHSIVGRSRILAEQVERSAYAPANPSLASEAQVISNADQSLLGALAAVEDALADVLDGGLGIIHVTVGALVVLQAMGGLIRDEEGRVYTASGHSVIGDAGYLGVSPMTNEPAAGELWVYGSGPVFAKYDDLVRYVGLDDSSNYDFTTNSWNLDAEQYGLAIFEPCSVVAALVDVSDGSLVFNDATP